MIGKNRVGKAVDAKDTGEKLHAVPYPAATVFEGFPGVWIIATKEGTPYAPLGAVHNLHLGRIHYISAG